MKGPTLAPDLVCADRCLRQKKQQRIGAVVKTEFMLFLCELSPQLKWNYEISQMFCGTKVLFLKILTHGKILGSRVLTSWR